MTTRCRHQPAAHRPPRPGYHEFSGRCRRPNTAAAARPRSASKVSACLSALFSKVETVGVEAGSWAVATSSVCHSRALPCTPSRSVSHSMTELRPERRSSRPLSFSRPALSPREPAT